MNPLEWDIVLVVGALIIGGLSYILHAVDAALNADGRRFR